MRLFLALQFDETLKDTLCAAQAQLRKHAAAGSFPRRENLHLTLVFIGETEHAEQAKAALDALREAPFAISLSKTGQFHRSDGAICWCGVRENAALRRVFAAAVRALRERGFAVEDCKFTPHVTLGRRVKLSPGFCWETFGQTLPESRMQVQSIHLMKSERIGGRIVYTPVHTVLLQKE